MMKRLSALLLAVTLLFTLSACGKKNETPSSAQEVATSFIRAYWLQDVPTYHSLYLHDARQRWEDQELATHKTEEAFCAEVRKQAAEKGLEVDIHSFDDYLREWHNNHLKNVQAKYGEYTASAEMTSSTPMSTEELTAFCAELKGGLFADYTTDEQINKITEGYTMVVTFRIDGAVTDFEENYNVYVVLCDGQWKVADHSA